MKNNRKIKRIARALLAKGLLGRDFIDQLKECTPGVTANDKRKALVDLKKEVGLLGQVIHDPNQYLSCKIAKVEKEKNPNSEMLVLLYRTPMCGSCINLRRGSCNLIGGRIVGSLSDIPLEVPLKVAKILVRNGRLGKKEAATILGRDLSIREKVVALLGFKVSNDVLHKKDVRAVGDSRKVCAMLKGNGRGVKIKEASLKGSGRVINAEGDWGLKWTSFKGDAATQRRAERLAFCLREAEIPVEVGEIREESMKVGLGTSSTFDVPLGEEVSSGRTGADEESALQTQKQLEKLVGVTTKLFRKGKLTAGLAERIYERMDVLRQHGAVFSKRGGKIAGQLAIMVGEMEL